MAFMTTESSSGRLTHVRDDGSAHMVDVSAKAVTVREASAAGRVLLSVSAVAALRAHPIAVHAVEVDLAVVDDGVTIAATVRTADRTGIEMEALTAVSVAALTVIDMVKAIDKHGRITDIRVTAKSGGRSGDWREDPADG